MKILLVSFIYGRELVGGAETFMAGLAGALTRRGHAVEVATTTASGLQAPSAFGIHWEEGFPQGVRVEDGIHVRRFPVMNHDRLQKIASRILLRRVRRDLEGRSYLDEEPDAWISFLVEKAQKRPALYQALYQFCRGPVAPGLLRFLDAHAGDYDAILATMVPFNTIAYAVKAAKKASRPVGVIPLFHALDWYHHWSHFYETFRAADALFVLNDASAALFNGMGCRSIRLGVGFEPGDFPADPEGAAGFRARHGLPETGAMLLFVGRKVQSKRYDLAMETVRRLRNGGEEVFLTMAGPDEDRRGVEGDGIFYLGTLPREELLRAYQACDILLEPTEFESFGIIFCEAWLYEKPVIGNRRCPAVASLVEHGRDGLLGATVEDFAEQVRTLLKNPEMGREMGRRGREKVLSEYTWDTIVEKIEAAFTEKRSGTR